MIRRPAVSKGTATPANEPEDQGDYAVATLYLPDPESRTGWALRGVARKKAEPPPSPKRRLGF